MPVFKIIPYSGGYIGFQPDDSRYVRLCSVLRIELDSIPPEDGSTIEQQFDLKYFIDLSDNNILKINFNYSLLSEEEGDKIPWNNLNPSNGTMIINFELIQKGSNINLVAAAEEQIIIPALTKGEY